MTCSTVGVDKSAYHPPLPPIRPSQTQDSCKGRQRKSWGRGKACSLWQTPFQVRQSGWLSSGSGLEILHWLWPYLGGRHLPLTIRNRLEFWKYILTSSRVLFQWTGFSHGTDGVSCLNIEKHGAAAATRPPTHSLMIPGFPKAHRRFKCTTRCAPQECFTCMLLYIQQTCCILYLAQAGSNVFFAWDTSPFMRFTTFGGKSVDRQIWNQSAGLRPLQTFDGNQYFICQLLFSTRRLLCITCGLHSGARPDVIWAAPGQNQSNTGGNSIFEYGSDRWEEEFEKLKSI